MTQTQTTTQPVKTIPADAAEHLIHKVLAMLSLILAGATAIADNNLDDQALQNAAEGITIVAEDARALLCNLIDMLAIDPEGDKAA
jgi:hypothetical protein